MPGSDGVQGGVRMGRDRVGTMVAGTRTGTQYST